jgi:MinD superfamily P-loop ATPase
MIIVVGGIQGGSGKTTIATNLAMLRSAENRDLQLIDRRRSGDREASECVETGLTRWQELMA